MNARRWADLWAPRAAVLPAAPVDDPVLAAYAALTAILGPAVLPVDGDDDDADAAWRRRQDESLW